MGTKNRITQRFGSFAVVASVLSAVLVPSQVDAQSSVTVYGALDAGVTYVSNVAGSSLVKLDTGVRNNNRFGFKGAEDIGGGTQVVFTLENGFNLGTGAANQGGAIFGRQAYVGFSNADWGTLTLGNQYSLPYDFTSYYNMHALASPYNGVPGDFTQVGWERLQNTVRYVSPSIRGVTFGAMYGFGGFAGDFMRGSSVGLGVRYTNGPVSAAATYGFMKNPGTGSSSLLVVRPYRALGVMEFVGIPIAQKSSSGAVADLYPDGLALDNEESLVVGASYKLGRATVAGGYSFVTFRLNGISSTLKIVDFGGSYQITPALFLVAGYQFDWFDGIPMHQIASALAYSLSKASTIYVSAEYLHAGEGMNPIAGYCCSAPSSNANQSLVRVGMTHRF